MSFQGISAPGFSGSSREISFQKGDVPASLLCKSGAVIQLFLSKFSAQSNSELKFGSVWAAGNSSLLVPFSIP